MNPVQRNAFEKEITLARGLMRRKEHDEAFVHLERAYVLGQQNTAPHVLSHWLMLRVAVHRREPAAIYSGRQRGLCLVRSARSLDPFPLGIRVVRTSACSSISPSTPSS